MTDLGTISLTLWMSGFKFNAAKCLGVLVFFLLLLELLLYKVVFICDDKTAGIFGDLVVMWTVV